MPAFSDLVFILFLLVFVVLWCLVGSLISRGGWRKLAQGHTAFSPPEGRSYRYQDCTLNRMIGYRKCLTFHIGRSGMGISVMPIFAVGHPALFFPWAKIRYKKESHSFFTKRFLYDLGTPRVGRVRVSTKIHRAIQKQTYYR
ncbi:MAG: hypothetical protein ACJAVK_000102 [Akkermansiaceae bacterium]|jgi:hypothetical protein